MPRSPFQLLLTLLILVSTLVITPGVQAQKVVVPNQQAMPVVDRANILTPDQEADISSRLKALAETDGTQIAVLTVPTTGEEDIFTFTHRTATDWGIGQKKENSGALFVVATEDRKMRIHVGYGLEGRLTDALSKRIISTTVTPPFRSGDYYKGISDGVDAIIAAVKGEYHAPPEQSSGGEGGGEFLFFLVVFGLMGFLVYNAWRNSRGGRGGRGGGHGAMLPNVWTTGGSSSGWGHSSGDFGGGGGGGGFGGGFGGGSFGGGGASGSW